ncbi:hypothetical protein DIU36_22150 [Mucilaginibacter rubeus]|nr:hypothetical protein DIU36_22150 [Mucilaginibacter rubeus]
MGGGITTGGTTTGGGTTGRGTGDGPLDFPHAAINNSINSANIRRFGLNITCIRICMLIYNNNINCKIFKCSC